MNDTSTFTGLHGEIADQVMGCSDGYAEYLAAYEAATDKAKFNAEFVFKGVKQDECD